MIFVIVIMIYQLMNGAVLSTHYFAIFIVVHIFLGVQL